MSNEQSAAVTGHIAWKEQCHMFSVTTLSGIATMFVKSLILFASSLRNVCLAWHKSLRRVSKTEYSSLANSLFYTAVCKAILGRHSLQNQNVESLTLEINVLLHN